MGTKFWDKPKLLQFPTYFENICHHWLLSSGPVSARRHSLIAADPSSQSLNAKTASYWKNSFLYSSIKHETLNSKHIAGGEFRTERFHTTATLSYPVWLWLWWKCLGNIKEPRNVIKQRYKLYARVNGLITSRRIFIILQNCSLKYTQLFVTKIFLGLKIN